MKKEKKITFEELIVKDYENAILELERARTNFDNAEKDYFEIANLELTCAQTKVDALTKKLKLMNIKDNLYYNDLIIQSI